MLMVFERDDGKALAVRQAHVANLLRSDHRMVLDQRKFLVRKPPRLVEHIVRNGDFAEIMEQRTERQLDDVFLVHAEQRREDAREHRHIHAVRKRVHVMRAQVRELHEVRAAHGDIIDDGSCRRPERPDIERPFPAHVLKDRVDVLDGERARLFLQNVFRRLDIREIWIHRHDVDARHAELLELFNVRPRQLHALRQIAAAALIVNALRRHHARLDLAEWQIDHTESLTSNPVPKFKQSSSSNARCSRPSPPIPRKTPVHARRAAAFPCTLRARAAAPSSRPHRDDSSARRAPAGSPASR